MRTAVVVGATGLVGGHLIHALTTDRDYEHVLALTRKPLAIEHPKLETRVVDFDALEEQRFEATDAFCSLGTTIRKAGSEEAFRKVDHDYVVAFAKASRRSASQLLVVSSLGADATSRVFYNRTKGEVENEVKALGFSGTHLFRPSFLEGDREETRVGEKIGTAAARALAVLPIPALRRVRPIEARVVAAVMVRVAKLGEPGVHVYQSDRIQALFDVG